LTGCVRCAHSGFCTDQASVMKQMMV
jgi:hypothetical protein